MKKRFFAVAFATALSAACLTGAVACSGSGSSDLTADEASSMIAGFTTSPTTISGTWIQDFDLAVDSDNSSFQAYAKDVTSTVTFDIDLTSGNLYYYGKLVEEDGTVTEQIVAKESGTYYYATTETGKTEIASESAALSMIDSLFKSLTTETSGWLDTDAFVYSGSDWITEYILLTSTNVSPTSSYFTYTYSKTDDEGLAINLDAQYVGYTGDAGFFEFGTTDTCTGSNISITTDSNGYILSFNQTVNNYLEMRITSDPIPLTYTGTRSLNATYGGTITQKTISSVNDSTVAGATTSDITVQSNANCTIETYDYSDYASLSTTSSTVSAGNYVAVKVTPASGYEVAVVLVNGNATKEISGYYCYMTAAKAGTTYNVSVTLKAEGTETATTGIVIYTDGDHYTVTCYDMVLSTYAMAETTSMTEGDYIALVITCDDGYEVTSVTVNGEATTLQGGKYYCYMTAVVSGAEYNVAVTASEITTSEITVQSNANCTIETYDYSDYASLSTTSSTVTAGNYVAVKVTPDDGYEVAVVLVNGNETKEINGYYCYMKSAVALTTYNVSVTLKTSGSETATTGTIVITATDNCTIETFDYAYGDYTTLYTTSTTVTEGNYVAVKVSCSDGYEVSSVTVNGESTSYINGYYCYMVTAVAGAEYNVAVTVAATSSGTETTGTIVTTETANCTIYTYDYSLGDNSTLAATSTTVTVGNYVAVKVECADGYEVSSVTINGTEATNYSGYYCVKASEGGITYTVVVTLTTKSAS